MNHDDPKAEPSTLYGSLLPKLVEVIQLTQTSDDKAALLRATNAFKSAMHDARRYADTLNGGELVVEEQDEVIGMLERIKVQKQQQLARFSEVVRSHDQGAKQSSSGEEKVNRARAMDVDSEASTPAAADS